jgi:hypothetical protein
MQYPAGYDRPIASLARWLLQSIETTYAANDTELPTRRLVTIGSVAVDAPLLAVMFGAVAVGPPGNEMNTPLRGDAPRTATLNVELWRETPAIGPTGNAPSAASISESSEIMMHDSWLLLESAYAADQTRVGIIANVTVNAPQGELHGVSMAVEMQIP